MFCPQCYGEYREGFTLCADCEVALVEILPPEVLLALEHRPANRFVTLASTLHRRSLEGLKGNARKERLFAASIDNGVASVLCILVASKLPVHLLSTGRWSIAILSYLVYFFVQEAVWGSTLGKRLFGLQVIRLDGGQVGWEEAGWRTLLRILEVNPLLFGAIPGGLVIACSRRKQRLGDLIAGTVVVNRHALVSEQETKW